ncbi:RNA-binding protein Cwf29 [Sorochytrium milnesiophthora]
MNNVRAVQNISHAEIEHNLADDSSSWHATYKDSAYVYIGGLPFELTEGDVICVFSQYGEVLDVNLVRDRETGKSRGFCFLKYEDQRSTVLAVDNLNGAKLLGRVLRVDHSGGYRRRDDDDKEAEEGDFDGGGAQNADDKRRWRELVDHYGGNVAPELWGKTIADFPQGLQTQEPEKEDDEDADAPRTEAERKLASALTNLDPDDPMYDYLKSELRKELAAEREKPSTKKHKKSSKKDKKSSDRDRDRPSARSRERSRSSSPRRLRKAEGENRRPRSDDYDRRRSPSRERRRY